MTFNVKKDMEKNIIKLMLPSHTYCKPSDVLLS